MLSTSSPLQNSLPLLLTTLGGKPLWRNAVFTKKKQPITRHPMPRLSRSDRELLRRLPDGELLFLSFLPSEGGTPVLVLRQGDTLLWLFSRLLRRPLPLSRAALSSRGHRILTQTLTAALTERITSLPETAAFLTERIYAEKKRLSFQNFFSVCDLVGKLLFSEDIILRDAVLEDATFKGVVLDDPRAAFAAYAQVISSLVGRPFYEEDGPPIRLVTENDELFFLCDDRVYAASRVSLPLGVEAVSPYAFRPAEGEEAFLFALAFDLFLPAQ